MNEKIIGVTVGTQLPKPNFKQTDPTKGDYIKNKPDFDGLKSRVDALEQAGGGSGTGIVIQPDEPIGANDGALWLDTDAQSNNTEFITLLSNHTADKANPHGVTAEQIGAAPAGYGLGEKVKAITTQWNSINKTGWYMAVPDSGVDGMNTSYWMGYHIEHDNGVDAVQRIWYNSHSVIRQKWDGVWQPWEWVNPPMVAGVEYRTTERFNGKPVYTKLILVSIDTFADYAEMYLIPHNISNFDESVSVDVSWLSYNSYWRHFPGSWFGDINWSTQAIASPTDVNLEIGTSAHRQLEGSAKPLRIVLRYTKTTY